ncbi:DUF3482 domain-containing protein [Psychrobacter sp. I-STPA10]|uniref:GTPase/DUF3482 domain-containing protein n=1 Tax=Psychrobacter sp. I-STPA10 TaxID=2585769 RepID=UPI001E5A8B71|nr:DUF3482 domain-containing protein [Psychrobacter sp. I-STPA10]
MTQPPSNHSSDNQTAQQGLFADKAFDKNTPTNTNDTRPAQSLANLEKLEKTDTVKNKQSPTLESQSHSQQAQQPPNKTTVAQAEPLKLAVVGHTNTGKTSLLRTLLRDVYFGEVKNEAATTRHVERAVISDSQTGEPLVALYDTPGLEDASGLMDWLEDNTASRRDGIERLQQFLASELADGEGLAEEDYSQEAKVIRQLLASDMALYVVDAREPVLGKYKDELAVLSWAAIPVMPVFNFTDSQDANISDWQTMLARRNLHISTRFDSVAFEFDDEIKLWQNLATMLTHSEVLNQLIERRQADWQQLYDEATIIIADFLLNVAAFMREIDDDADPMPVLAQMQEVVRQSERGMQHELLNLYKFYDSHVATTPLQLNEYQQDPFDPELLKSYGIRTTSGAAAGALLGLGIDAAALGTTMGLGAALGGLAGGLLSNTSSIADKISGVKRLYIDPATLTLLATRSMDLLQALRHRGHATCNDNLISQSSYQTVQQGEDNSQQAITTATLPWDANKLPSELKKARSKPHWSSLDKGNSEQAKNLRLDAAWSLSRKLTR